MPKVFISHSWEDNEISRKIAENLKRDGAEIWIDYARIHGGDSLPARISEALEWCDTLILMWSKTAKNSHYVNLEWGCALDMQKIIIPCLLDTTQRPAILRSYLYVDFRNADTGYTGLLHALHLERKQTIPSNKKATTNNIRSAQNERGIDKINVKLRSRPEELSVKDVKLFLKKYDLFDINKNNEGNGIVHQYKAEDRKGDKIVFDNTTGLIWQQSGSSESMNYENAKKWKDDLNEKGFAGYNDWRLPTLEEAMSLMESQKNKNDLYIDPIFDSKQWWIWTADPVKSERRQWVVRFDYGLCYDLSLLNGTCVRAVRYGQSSVE